MELLKTLSQAWKVEELRKKILFTLMMLVVYRIGSNIPVPGINRAYLSQMFSGETGLLDLFDLFSGGSFSNFRAEYHTICYSIYYRTASDNCASLL